MTQDMLEAAAEAVHLKHQELARSWDSNIPYKALLEQDKEYWRALAKTAYQACQKARYTIT